MASILFPASCVGCKCDREGPLCSDCARDMIGFQTSMVAGRVLWTCGEYQGLLKECVLFVKSKGHKVLAKELAVRSTSVLLSRLPSEFHMDAVMAVPASKQGQKFRGFSLPILMEKAVCHESGWPALSARLRRDFQGVSTSSKGLSRPERWMRRSEALVPATSREPRGSLLLLDDVVTTGSTFARCIKVAESQGFDQIYCFALAEHRPQNPAFDS